MSRKAEWQKNKRDEFKRIYGYSQTAHYRTGKQRQRILARDGFRCTVCGMTDAEHKSKWNRPITIDHKNKDRKNNNDENLTTLCLRCHGKKDISPALTHRKVEKYKDEILSMRATNTPYQKIADHFGFSIAAIWKWHKIWTNGGTNNERRISCI